MCNSLIPLMQKSLIALMQKSPFRSEHSEDSRITTISLNQIAMKSIFRNAIPLLAVPAFISASSFQISAAPAKPGTTLYTQPDGEQIGVVIRGDEYLHWYETPEGALLQADESGALIPADADFRSRLAEKKRNPSRVSSYTTFPTSGSQRVLVILVQFSDRAFTYGASEFEAMLTAPGYSARGGYGSARDYYIENSAGAFMPEFDIYGPVTMPNPVSYYGGNDDEFAHKMVAEACRQLDGEVDFSEYDRDGDGWVDNVYIFYAGQGEADGGGVNTIWPHSANIYTKGERLLLDGVQIGRYACSNEIIGGSTSMVGIGTFCHEFAHVLGLPDLYATNGEAINTPYYWSLMDHGNYNGNGRRPCALTAYERYFLGWTEPVSLTDDASVRIPDISKNLFYRIDIPGENQKYFLLENRSAAGWDEGLPGHGLLIWYIDYDKSVWDSNGVNNDPSRQRVNLVEANGLPSLNRSSGHPFPGTSGVTSFSGFSTYCASATPHQLKNIHEDGKDLVFAFNAESLAPAALASLNCANPDDNFATISWSLPASSDAARLWVSTRENGRLRQLPEYCGIMVSDSEFTLRNLLPDTDYEVVARAQKGNTLGKEEASISFVTAHPGITYQIPTALDAENVTANSFTARWEQLDMADDYLISVYQMIPGAADADDFGFTNPFSLPAGWESNTTQLMSVNGYFGDAAPSLRMANNADMIVTPLYSADIESLKFWIRGYKATATTKLKIEAYADGEWLPVNVLENIDNTKGSICFVDNLLPEHSRRIRLTLLDDGKGSVCIDDITIGFGMELRPQYILQEVSAGNSTSYLVTGLSAFTEYRYNVVATSGNRRSAVSNEILVNTDPSSVETSDSDFGNITVYGIDGTCFGNKIPMQKGIRIISGPDGNKKIIK